MDKLTTLQMIQAQDSYHYAIAAAGGTVDGVQSAFAGETGERRTKTQFIVLAWNAAKAAGLPVKRPRGPVDGAPMARSIVEFCQQQGIDANTGLPLAAQVAEDDEEELLPEPHRCKDAGGYCRTCLS